MTITLDNIFIPSEDVVANEFEGEFILICPAVGKCSAEGVFFSLSEHGAEVWKRLDGKESLGEVASELAEEYSAGDHEIERDVIELVQELVSRKILVEVGISKKT